VPDLVSSICSLQAVPREVAAAINPVISEVHRHSTMEEAADLIERMGLATCGDDCSVDLITVHRLHQQLASTIAGALRYEVAQELKDFPITM
jgi:hypothetical protein